MKRKYLIIVGLILTFLTIGAVSASEDTALDDISASDEGADIEDVPLNEAPQTVEIIGNADAGDSDVLEDPAERALPSYHISVPDDVRMGGNGFDEDERFDYAAVLFFDYDIGGSVSIFVDEELKYNENAYQSDDAYYANQLKLSNLDLPAGTHNLTVKYSGDENYLPFEENRSFEIYYMKVQVPEEVLIGGSGSEAFKLIFTMDASGYADLYIDGDKKWTYDVFDARESDEEIGPNIYVNLDEFDLSFGSHTYKVEYYGGNYDDKNISGSFNLGYSFEVEPYTSIYGDPIDFHICLPSDALGTVNVTLNDKVYHTESEGGWFVYQFYDAEIGVNNFSFTYEDSKYPKKTVNLLVYNPGVIRISNFQDIVYYGSDCNIYLVLPSDANGNLSLYRSEYNWESGDYELHIINTVPLQDGRASISVSTLGLDYFDILAKYTGEDYDVEDQAYYFNIEPGISPRMVWIKEINDTEISINVPEISGDTLKVELTVWDETGDSCTIYELYNGPFKSQVVTLPEDLDLKAGSYQISLQDIPAGEEYPTQSWSSSITISEIGHDLDLELIVPQEVPKLSEGFYESDTDYVFIPKNLPLNYAGLLSLYIDGKYVSSMHMDDIEGEFTYDLTSLSLGTHTWRVDLTGDSYYNDASLSGSFEVIWYKLPETIIIGADLIFLDFNDDSATGYASLKIDGKDYAMVFLEGGCVRIYTDDIPVGMHTYEFMYSGDANHEKFTKSGSFNAVMNFYFPSLMEGETYTYSNPFGIDLGIDSDATGNVVISIDGTNYTQEIINGSVRFEVPLAMGTHTVVARYLGDDKHSPCEISVEFTIDGYAFKVNSIYEDEDPMTESVSLSLPSDATGNMTITQYYWDDDYNMIIQGQIASVPLTDGYAFYSFRDNLRLDCRNVIVRYEGEDYEVEAIYLEDIICRPIIEVSDNLNIGENGTVEINVGNATGNVIIFINGEEFKMEALSNGKINVTIPADKFKLGENSIGFKYVGTDLDEYIFGYYDDELGEYVPYGHYVNVEPTTFAVPSKFSSNGSGSIAIELPEGYDGNVTVYVDGNIVSTTPVTSGVNNIPISGLKQGYSVVKVVYQGDNGQYYEQSDEVYVPNPEPEVDITSPVATGVPEFSVNLPSDATGSLIISVDGKNFGAALENGKATIEVPGLADGVYEVMVRYTGDGKYSGFTKSVNVTVNSSVPAKIVAKDLTAYYNKASYSVTVYGTDGNVASGVLVTFSVNGKKVGTAKTNANGVATIKLSQLPKTYKITSTALGKSVTKKLTVKQVLTLKKIKVRKSARKLVITATLKEGKNPLKSKRVVFKFKGKTYKAKTNKKGVAKITVKKSVLKRLKVGKKVKYQVTYLKDTVKKTVKVKR